MKAKVDPDLCIGCSLCAQLCPEIFSMKDDKAVACTDTVEPKNLESCKKAVDECPVTAISME
ncbi:ferredoxin [bacterium]|nr:ferredoxin [bacterium]